MAEEISIAHFYRHPEKLVAKLDLDIKPSGRRFIVNGEKPVNRDVLPKKLAPIIEEKLAQFELMNDWFKYDKKDRFFARVTDEALAIFSEDNNADPANSPWFDWGRYAPCQVMGEENELRVYDKRTNKVSTDITFDNLKKGTPRTVQEKDPDWQAIRPIVEVFDPTEERHDWSGRVEFSNDYSPEILHTNSYREPNHFRMPNVGVELPEFVDELLNSLTNNDPFQKHVLCCWIKHCLFDKAKTTLCLIGKAGAGKGTFSVMLRHLIGLDYSNKTQTNFFDSDFNAVLMNTRFLYHDETVLDTYQKLNKAKSYVEDEENIHIKHVNAVRSVKLHASHVINSNHYNFRFSPDERKFTVLDLGDKNFREIRPTEEIQKFVEEDLKNSEYLARLVNYFREYPCDRRPDDDYKGETFWYVVRHYGLSSRERFLLNYLYGYDVGEEIPFRKINQKWKNEKKNNTLLDYNDIDTLIRKFKMAGISIATLSKDSDNELIITNLAKESDLMKTDYFDDDLGGL